MAKEETGEVLTLEHVLYTLDRIEEWVGLVKAALSNLDPKLQVPFEPPPLAMASIRQTGKKCHGLAPPAWKDSFRESSTPKSKR